MYSILILQFQNKPSSNIYFENLFNDNDIDWAAIYMLPRLQSVTKIVRLAPPSPIIQCWLDVCLLISGLGCLLWLLQAWYNIESGGRGDFL